ncbi:MAG TPA: ABC transporter ATP-binding protein [Hyphomonas sp.]|nr:hypothetical protein [Hyphomonas sp.]HRJ02188.1 ABC transporter ATP-binding protein [Hyphomonas sp.]
MRGDWSGFRLLRRELGAPVAAHLAGAGALTLLAAFLATLAPLALKLLMDAAAPDAGAALRPEVWVVAYVCLLALVRMISEGRTLLFGAAEQALTRKLARGALLHALTLPAAYHSGKSTGEIQQVLENGIQGYRTLLQHALLTLGPGIVELVLMAGIVFFWLDGAFLAVFAAFAAAYTAVFAATAIGVVQSARKVSALRIEANAWLADGLMNQDAVRATSGAQTVCARYDRCLAGLQAAWFGLYRARLVAGILTALVMAGGLSAALLLSLEGIRAGDRTIGDLVLVHAAMLQVVRPLEMLAGALRDAGQAAAFAERLDDLLSEAPEIPPDDVRPQTEASPLPAAIRFENVSFAHPGGRTVIDGVSFEIPAGARAAIVGPSGGGKSTLLRLLLRFHEPREGRILVGGVPSTDIPLEEYRRRFAAILQEGGLFDASLAFNIGFPDEAAEEASLLSAARVSGLEPLLSALPDRLEARMGERGMRISGGERQRIILARAIRRGAGVLVADEPASALDPASRVHFRQVLFGEGIARTVVVISHVLTDVCGADIILVMDRGRLVEQGTHPRLLARGGVYARMWNQQG